MTSKEIDRQMLLVETFLMEFCKVKNVNEIDLGSHLRLRTFPMDNTIVVVGDDGREIFGVRTSIHTEDGAFTSTFEVFGEYLKRKQEYPETTRLIEDGGEITRDIDTPTGEQCVA